MTVQARAVTVGLSPGGPAPSHAARPQPFPVPPSAGITAHVRGPPTAQAAAGVAAAALTTIDTVVTAGSATIAVALIVRRT
jgi:hypothetical protein